MESISPTAGGQPSVHDTDSHMFSPKYRLARIKSKFMILDILGYAGFFDDSIELLHKSCQQLRLLVNSPENYQAAQYRLPRDLLLIEFN